MPELADLGVTHSGRGYAPYPVSHWGADWWDGWRLGDAPRWPGVVYEGRAWSKDDLRAFYEPWRAVERAGAPVHIGEFGCYRNTPNADALRWFADLLGLFHESAGGSRSGTSRDRSASSTTAARAPGSNGAAATSSTSTCWSCSSRRGSADRGADHLTAPRENPL